MSWSREELRKIPWQPPRQALELLEESCSSDSELPSLTVYLEGGFQLQAEFVSYRRDEALLVRPLEPVAKTVDLMVIPLERLVALTLHYQGTELRRQLRKKAPGGGLLTPLGLRREVEFWLEPWRSNLGLTLAVDVAWSDFLRAAPPHEVLPVLQEGLASLRQQLEGIALSKLGVQGLKGVGSILISPLPAVPQWDPGYPGSLESSFSLTRTGAQVSFCPALEDGLPLWPSAAEFRRALEKVL